MRPPIALALALVIAAAGHAACGDIVVHPDGDTVAIDTAAQVDSGEAVDTAPPVDTGAPLDTAPPVDSTVANDTTPADAADVTACPPVVCALDCTHGLAPGADGCPTCACRACAAPTDCVASGCPRPRCSAAGACGCDCAASAPALYPCPDGTPVPHCACANGVWRCQPHPELACPTLCQPAAAEPWPCPDGTPAPWCTCAAPAACGPRCERVGEPGEGFYDACSGALVRKGACAGCAPVCGNIGTRSEGWFDCTGALLGWTFCGPARTCVDSPETGCADLACTAPASATFPCPLGGASAPFCACDAPAAACAPVCLNANTNDEGWYDGCTGAPLAKRKCASCTVSCDAIGSKSEGWYDSCSGLVTWALCATGTWGCAPAPWGQCGL